MKNLFEYTKEFVKSNFSKRIMFKIDKPGIPVENNNKFVTNEKKLKKLELIRKVKMLYKDENKSYRDIAKTLKINRETVAKYVNGDEKFLINYNTIKNRYSIASKYIDIIKEMLNRNETITSIYNEIVSLGYKGKYGSLRNFISTKIFNNNDLKKDESFIK